jgi:DNA-binding transcriptional LysR family regulator
VAPRTPADLAGHNCLVFSPLGWGGTWRFLLPNGETLSSPVAGTLCTDSAEVLLEAALSGLGVALLPLWAAAEALRAGSLVRLLADHPLPVAAIHAVYPANRLMSAKVRAFVDHLARHCRRNPDWEKAA